MKKTEVVCVAAKTLEHHGVAVNDAAVALFNRERQAMLRRKAVAEAAYLDFMEKAARSAA